MNRKPGSAAAPPPRRSSHPRGGVGAFSTDAAPTISGHTKRAAGRTWGRRQPNAATPPDATEARRRQLEGRQRGGGRRAGTPGRAPTEQTVAGMLTHGHASTVSSSGMTELVLIRAHRRAAHSRLSLSSSTHIARIRSPNAFRPFGTGRSARHFCLLQRRNRAELLMPRGRQRSRRRPSVAPPLQSLERDGLQASDAVARREAALDLYRLDHLPLRRERLDGFRHLIGDDLAA